MRRPSRALLRFFDLYLGAYVPLHFNALRIFGAERFPLTARPLIVVINHPSWWDPLTSILLSRYFLRQADHYAPIDAASLPKHRILAAMGVFPVEQGTPRGAAQFLRAATAILSDPHAVLWLTPQGAFTDVRSRPIRFKPGLASLIKRVGQVTVLPLAYEYTFWNQPRPEMLALVGEPLVFSRAPAKQRGAEIGQTIADALAHAQDELAALALTRDPECFLTLRGGVPDQGTLRAMASGLWHGIQAKPYLGQSAKDTHSDATQVRSATQ